MDSERIHQTAICAVLLLFVVSTVVGPAVGFVAAGETETDEESQPESMQEAITNSPITVQEGEYVYTAAERLIKWDQSDGSRVWERSLDGPPIRGVDVSEDGETVYAITEDTLYKIDSGGSILNSRGSGYSDAFRSFVDVVVSEEAGIVATGIQNENELKVFSTSGLGTLYTRSGFTEDGFSLAISRDEQYLYAMEESNNDLQKFNASQGTTIWQVSSKSTGSRANLEISADDNMLFFNGVAYNTDDGSVKWQLPYEVHGAATTGPSFYGVNETHFMEISNSGELLRSQNLSGIINRPDTLYGLELSRDKSIAYTITSEPRFIAFDTENMQDLYYKDYAANAVDFSFGGISTVEPTYPPSVSGTVSNTNGDPVVNATVSAEVVGGEVVQNVTTDSNGDYELLLEPGDYYINASNKIDSNETLITVGSSDITGVDLTLREGGLITGYVEDSADKRLPGIEIEAAADSAGNITTAQTNSNGYYEMVVEPDGYNVTATNGNESFQKQTTVDNVDDVSVVNFTFARAALITGVVDDQNGDRIYQADIEVTNTTTGFITARDTVTQNGRYYVYVDEKKQYNVTGSKDGYLPDTATVKVDDVATYTQNLELFDIEEGDDPDVDEGDNETDGGSGDDENAIGDKITVLNLQTTNFLKHGQSADFEVLFRDPRVEGRVNVEDSATVRSSNTDVVTVNNRENTITATTDDSVATKVTLTATYKEFGETWKANATVTVANESVDNIEVLPPDKRVQVTFEDDTFFAILVSVMLSVMATYLAGAFAGIGTGQLSITIFWLIGYTTLGIALVSLFAALFIGLNLGANIDYNITR